MLGNNLVDQLTRTVQFNCDIVDARHGAEMGMCTYLLKMREYYRWEKGFGFSDRLPSDDIGEWLSEREAQWEGLVDRDYEPLKIGESEYDPFDAEGVNAVLEEHALAYSGGYIGSGKPHFFLARLESFDTPDDRDYAVRVCDQELARGLSAPPALSREQDIFLRREALRRFLWERLEIWRWNSPKNALARAFRSYDFENDPESALNAMTDRELQTMLQHEIGELEVTRLFGKAWHDMLLDLLGTPAELMARAARDCLADCLCTLPYLAKQGEESSLHFLVGSLTNMRKEIFPGLVRAYDEWTETGDSEPFEALAEVGVGHWKAVVDDMVHLHKSEGAAAALSITEMVRENYL